MLSTLVREHTEAITDQREPLLDLLRFLDDESYDFVTATPNTHARVVARPERQTGRTLRDLLGWSLPVASDALPGRVVAALEEAGRLTRRPDGLVQATVRVSRVYGALFLHSAYPTTDQDSVFLGPDSYRFADLIMRRHSRAAGLRILDYGAGAGVGGITAARQGATPHLTLADINPKALFLASINAEHAGIDHRAVEATSPSGVEGPFDLIVTHPPFMMDEGQRAYRDGGDLYGGQLSLDWTLEALELLARGGRLVLHTGVSIVDGRDVLHDAFGQHMPPGYDWDYHLLDPDIFGDELDQPPYREVERIAAIGLTVTRN
jgi:methylase of polypeptide subunit release factors